MDRSSLGQSDHSASGVQKQFEDEMTFVKKVAVEEKATKTTKATDDLVTARRSDMN